MKRNREKVVQMRFTLPEALIYITVLGVITTSFITFFHAGVKLNRQARMRTVRYQEIQQIHRVWRDALAETDPDRWQAAESEFRSDALTVSAKAGKLLVQEFKDTRTLAMPKDGRLQFKIEGEGTDKIAVMNISFPARPGFRAETIRLVAKGK